MRPESGRPSRSKKMVSQAGKPFFEYKKRFPDAGSHFLRLKNGFPRREGISCGREHAPASGRLFRFFPAPPSDLCPKRGKGISAARVRLVLRSKTRSWAMILQYYGRSESKTMYIFCRCMKKNNYLCSVNGMPL